jgi:hypothetical protein
MIFGSNQVRGEGLLEEIMPCVLLARKLLGLCMEIRVKEKWKEGMSRRTQE